MIKDEFKDLKEDEFIDLIHVDDEYKGRYEVNKKGEIRIKSTKRIIKPHLKDDYPKIILRSEGNKNEKRYFLHKLLALTFLENNDPENKTQVDHINSNVNDYRLDNLQWITPSDNLKKRGEMKSWDRLKYNQLDDQGNIIKTFSRTELTKNERGCITTSIKNKIKYKGFYWEAIDEEVEEYYNKFTKEEREKEEWKSIKEDKDIQVSSLGLVKFKNGSIRVGHKNASGYRTVNINKSHKRVHRLVYETFTGQTLKDTDIIDHIDTDRCNNSLSNLRLCTDQSENLSNPITKIKISKKVKQYSLEGDFIKEWDSIYDVLKYFNKPITNSRISSCCRGYQVTAYGYLWCYSGEEDKIQEKLEKIK